MKRMRIFFVMLLMHFTLYASAICIGDLNGDNKVTIKDIAILIDMLNGNQDKTDAADIDGNGKVDTEDLSKLIDFLLGSGITKVEHKYVDLGLSVKWASCNLGAVAEWNYGNYYSWGETTHKSNYSEDNYAYYQNGQYQSIGQNICGTRYDAVTTAWGDGWRMPTLIDINQLMNRCTWTELTKNGINGYKVTGPNGNSIFLPKCGMMTGTSPSEKGIKLYYWCGMSPSSTSTSAYVLNDSGYSGAWSASRSYGFPIRPVYTK